MFLSKEQDKNKMNFSNCKVVLYKLTDEDLKKYNIVQKYRASKAEKRSIDEQKEKNKRANLGKEKGSVGLKLIPSKKGKNDTLESKLKSTPNIENDDASTSSNETRAVGNTVGDNMSKHTKSSNSLIAKSKDRDPRTINDGKITLREVQRTSNEIIVDPSKQSPKAFPALKKRVSMNEIEEVFKKYFFKSNQDIAIIVANILNVISLSEKHHKSKFIGDPKKATEVEKFKKRCDARIHLYHKKVLETKLKRYFNLVVNSFTNEEFKIGFILFFLIILTILRSISSRKSKKRGFINNSALLLRNSLKNIKFEDPNIFLMLNTDIFRGECINLINLIEETRKKDPLITNRMSILFVSSESSKDCFLEVINAITSDSTNHLAVLIENAANQLRSSSKFKKPQHITSPEDTTDN